MFAFIMLWFFSFIGLGKFALQISSAASVKTPEREDIGRDALFGAILVTMLSLGINFRFAISPFIAAAILCTGLLCFLFHAKYLLRAIGFKNLIGLLIAAIFIGHLGAVTKLFPLDTAIYHLQSIRWIRESPVVAGLANLEGKLGFNSVWFSLAAAMSSPGMAAKGAFLINAVFLLIYLSILQNACGNYKDRGSIPYSSWFIAATVFPVISEFILSRHAVYPSTDAPGMLLFFILIFYALKAHEKSNPAEYAGFIFMLALWAFVIKMSALIYFLAALAALVYAGFKTPPFLRSRSNQIFLLAAFFLGLLWSLKGLTTSGCLFFPNSWGCLSQLEWRVPDAILRGEIEVIRGWAKKPYFQPGEQTLHNWQWLKPWLQEAWKNLSFRYCCGMVVIGIVLALKKTAGQKKPDRLYGILALISIAGIIFWFANAPDPRFGMGYLGTLGALILSFAIQRLMSAYSSPIQKRSLMIFILLSLLPALSMVRPQKLNRWSWPQIKEASYHQEQNKHGVKVNIPDQKMLCWDTPLPCAPFLRAELRTHDQNADSKLPVMYFYADGTYPKEVRDLSL